MAKCLWSCGLGVSEVPWVWQQNDGLFWLNWSVEKPGETGEVWKCDRLQIFWDFLGDQILSKRVAYVFLVGSFSWWWRIRGTWHFIRTLFGDPWWSKMKSQFLGRVHPVSCKPWTESNKSTKHFRMYSRFMNSWSPPKNWHKPEKNTTLKRKIIWTKPPFWVSFAVSFPGLNTPPGHLRFVVLFMTFSATIGCLGSRLKHSNLVRKCISTCLAVGNVPRFSDFCWSKICGRPQLWVGGRIPAKRRNFTEALKVRIGFESAGSWLVWTALLVGAVNESGTDGWDTKHTLQSLDFLKHLNSRWKLGQMRSWTVALPVMVPKL